MGWTALESRHMTFAWLCCGGKEAQWMPEASARFLRAATRWPDAAAGNDIAASSAHCRSTPRERERESHAASDDAGYR